MSPTGSTPNLTINHSVASLPHHWNSTTNLPIGHSTPSGPSPQHPPPGTVPRMAEHRAVDPGPREINLQHYFPSSSGYTAVSSVPQTNIPLDNSEFMHGHARVPSERGVYPGERGLVPGDRGMVHPRYHVPRNPQEMSEMFGGHYESTSPKNSVINDNFTQEPNQAAEVSFFFFAKCNYLDNNTFVKM